MVEPDSAPLDNLKLRELWACGYSFQRHATQGKTQMFGNMCDIWDSAHICTLDRLTKCAHSHALFQISIRSQSTQSSLWHFTVASRFLLLYFETVNFWTWSAAAVHPWGLYVWIL